MRLTFGWKIGLAICLLAVGTTGAGLTYFYTITYSNVWEELARRLADVGRTGQFLFTEEHRNAIERLNRETDRLSVERTPELLSITAGNTEQSLTKTTVKELQSSKDFLLLINVLRQIKNASRNDVTPLGTLPQSPQWFRTDPPLIRFAYLLVAIKESPDRSILKFIADGDNEENDQDGNGQISADEQPTEIGQLYNVSSQPGLMAAFDGKVQTSKEYYEDKWGTWMSAYIPIKRPDGSVIAILGIDMSASSQLNLIRRLKYTCIGVIGASFFLSVFISFLLSRWLARPIVLLREGAERVKARDYSTRIEIKSSDELGILAATFNEMVDEVRDHAQTLEQKVAARTLELQNTLETVQALKAQQDADYYLTNLLANPLFKNYNRSVAVQTEFFVKQKKEFKFRDKAGELGGDMCVTGNLKFRGKRYTMFVNGDAMGKSLQGAGGALIMGSVVNSIMSRSASNKRDLDMDPRDWLRETYQEIHNVFLTFDGSMYVSCILGVVNDESGEMLFFNAEHPAAVLFRNGRACFLEEDIHLRKLGSQIQGKYVLTEVQLQPGDVVFVGSDGRDDLNLTPGDVNRVINEDEHLFVRIVEEANGNLDEIVRKLHEKGEITDDISLIKISYKPATANRTALVQINTAEVVRLMKDKRYSETLTLLENQDLTTAGPLLLYYKGLCLERLGREQEALPFLERAIHLDQEQVAVLKVLGNVYFKMGKFKEAAESLERAIELRPGDKLRSALDRVKKRMSPA
ncbi:MAG: SpoIIE family protein phosphatase [Leptospirales bacterium]|nr:SpoIIE family protein phosphatase [Leptospirales bacterium]